MKSKSTKSSKETEEKIRKKEKQEAAFVDWCVRVIMGKTMKEINENNKENINDKI
ncbi:hypothetical protein [Flavobacterium sharifuzzamanii]|uniref:hypothetical protein n=1 Tax=Flavobacterium sharifuzzamanii TaxID=2211133 RepID=UPI0013006EC1|nr:hypothetical protein [Flavobacterium sharifuzzamanii]KAF2078935.1 hypothetical protein DMA14_20830 [Flavobacterium sharifuzzamanii]